MSPAPVTTVVDGHGPVIDFFDDPPGDELAENPRRPTTNTPGDGSW